MTQRSPGQPSRAVTCVLWRAKGTTTPDKLLRSLAKKRVRVIETDSPTMAMAHICAQERTRRLQTLSAAPHTPNQPESPAGTVLLLVEPTHLSDVGHVVDLVQRYAPRTACWRYDADATPALRGVTDHDLRQWLPDQDTDDSIWAQVTQPSPAKPTSRPSPPKPSLRLAGEHEPTLKRTDKEDDSAQPSDLDDRFESTARSKSSLVLTQEELAMLLTDHIGQLDAEPRDHPDAPAADRDNEP